MTAGGQEGNRNYGTAGLGAALHLKGGRNADEALRCCWRHYAAIPTGTNPGGLSASERRCSAGARSAGGRQLNQGLVRGGGWPRHARRHPEEGLVASTTAQMGDVGRQPFGATGAGRPCFILDSEQGWSKVSESVT